MANSNRDSNPTDTEKQRRFEKVFDDYVQRINAGETFAPRRNLELFFVKGFGKLRHLGLPNWSKIDVNFVVVDGKHSA